MKLVVTGEQKMKDLLKAVRNYLISKSEGYSSAPIAGVYVFMKVKDPAMMISLKKFEKSHRIENYKFGILYCKAGQTEENQMFSNGLFVFFHKNFSIIFFFFFKKY